MGGKRWSSKAAVKAYSCRPFSRGRGLKVPMQPRRALLPLRDEMVFHVTKSGYGSLGSTAEREERDVRLEDVDACVEVDFDVDFDVRLEDDEFEVGVAELRRREMAGARDVDSPSASSGSSS